MQIPAKLKEQIEGQPVAICGSVSVISGDLSIIGDKTLVFTDLPGLYLHDSGGMLGVEQVCKQVKMDSSAVRLKFTNQSRALSGEIKFPGGIEVDVKFTQSVARIADMLVTHRVGAQADTLFSTPLPVSIRVGASEAPPSEEGESTDELQADVVVAGSRLRLKAKNRVLLDVPLDRVRSTLQGGRKIELKGEMIVNDASVTMLAIMLPSRALAAELFRVVNGATQAAPELSAAHGLVAPVHVKGPMASGQTIDSHVDAILSDEALELRAMDTGATLSRFVFADANVHVAGTAKQFILASPAAGPVVVSGGANKFRERLAQSEAVRAAAQRTLAQGAHPVFLNGDAVVCQASSEGIAIRTATGNVSRELPPLSALRRESTGDQEGLAIDGNDAVRFDGERNVLESLFAAIATQCCRRQFVARPRELIGAIVALERDYFIYSLFGPLYEVHAILAQQSFRGSAPEPIALPDTFDKKLALSNLLAQGVEPLRNHLDKVCYYFPSLLVKGDAAICAAQQPPHWLKDHERAYRSVFMGVQPVLAEIRMLRELLQRIYGVEERLARDADYGGATLSAALGAVINPLFLLSAAQQAFSASSSADAQKAQHSETADHSVDRAIQHWNYLTLELLPGLWHHLLEALFPIRLQFYDHVRKQCEAESESSALVARLAGRLAVLMTFLHYPASDAAKVSRGDMAASARILQSQLSYAGLQQI